VAGLALHLELPLQLLLFPTSPPLQPQPRPRADLTMELLSR